MALKLERLGKMVIPPFIGRVAIGEKDEKGFPKKVDHFLFTHLVDPKAKRAPIDEEATKAMCEKHGEKPKRIRVVLAFDHPEEVFYSSLTNYPGARGWDCKSADGVTAIRKDKNGEQFECDCDYTTCTYKVGKDGKDTCKATGILSFLLLDVPRTGGLWRFTTRGYTSVFAITQALDFMYKLRGSLRGLEVEMLVTMTPMTVPDPRGGMSKQNVPIVSVQLPYSARELANGSGTVYGDFKEIMESAKKNGSLPNQKIIQSIGMTIDDEDPIIDGTLTGETEESSDKNISERSRNRSRSEESDDRSGSSDRNQSRETNRHRSQDVDDNPF